MQIGTKREADGPLDENKDGSLSPPRPVPSDEVDERSDGILQPTPLTNSKSVGSTVKRPRREVEATKSFEFSWERVPIDNADDPEEAPQARWGTASCIIENGTKLVIFGGQGANGEYLDDLWTLDLSSMAWSSSPSVDRGGRAFQSIFLATTSQGERLMTYGGERAAPRTDGAPPPDHDEGNERVLGDLSCFDLDAELWYSPKVTCEGEDRATAAGVLSQRAGYTCATLDDGRVLVFAGVDGEGRFRNDTVLINPRLLTWQRLGRDQLKGAPPKPRAYHTAVRVGRRLVVFGGVGSVTWALKEIHSFDLETFKWTEHSGAVQGDAPSARFHHSAVALDGRYVAVFGGMNTEPAETYFNDLAILDTVKWQWTRPAPSLANGKGVFPLPRAGCVMVPETCREEGEGENAAPSRTFLVFGGRQDGDQYTNEVWRLRIDQV